MLTGCRPSAFRRRFSADDLPGQLALARDPDTLPPQWPRRRIGELLLAHHPELRTLHLTGCEPSQDVIFLGPVIDPIRRRLDALNWVPPREGFFPALERLLHGLSGRFVCIAGSGKRQRLYLDASGSLSMLYSRRHAMAASTVGLFPDDGEDDDAIELIEAIDVGRRNGCFPFGLTPRRSIRRLLPNHLLNLDTWKARRHWPLAAIQPARNRQRVLGEIADLLLGTVEAVIAAGHRPYLSLTAGYDSRVLLALLRHRTDAVDWFTWELPDATAQLDVQLAVQLASSLGLKHTVITFQAAEAEEQSRWLHRSGLAVGELRGMTLAATVEAMGAARYYLPGLGSEVGRARYWRKHDHEASRLRAGDLLGRLGLPADPRLRAAARRWLRHLENDNSLQRLDLLHIEQRLGCWAGVTAYGDAHGPIRIHPFSNRRVFELMLSLPAEMRRNDAIPQALIRNAWPELLAFPVNGHAVPETRL
ncbi:hypothetical protein [Cyanobium sp. CH-040]|uniref:hypothetical protein n=1 Tax=Cyanobium sp. CH-040 TaxID=2823708 RepID=UPI0020CF640D|nr:hypothetical protein [Cyanobium sp. CH-040]MCP9928007.1 hypothetical protein [Cyanobium sp. CH-040]